MSETWFRHADRRYPFLVEGAGQPSARWHAAGRGPVQYLADTPEGAWAEFLRHEGITSREDLAGVTRALWAVEVDRDTETVAEPSLPAELLTGGIGSYAACRAEAERLRGTGATAILAPSAALLPAGASGEVTISGGLRPAAPRDGLTLSLFGERPELAGHVCVEAGAAPERVLALTRPLQPR